MPTIVSLSLPRSVKSVAARAFDECESLQITEFDQYSGVVSDSSIANTIDGGFITSEVLQTSCPAGEHAQRRGLYCMRERQV